MQITGMKQYIF